MSQTSTLPQALAATDRVFSELCKWTRVVHEGHKTLKTQYGTESGRVVIPVGGVEPTRVDIRIIAASNADMQEKVSTKEFRMDLFYRLNVASLQLPPLRERPDDILPLSKYFIEEFNKKYNKSVNNIQKEDAMNILVTGVSGFLASKLLPLLMKNHKVRGFDIKQPESLELEFIQGDIRDFNAIKTALNGIELVIHLSAITAKPSAKDPLFGLDVNVKGTYNLAEASVQAGAKKIIFASSLAVYGSLSEDFVPEYLPIDENRGTSYRCPIISVGMILKYWTRFYSRLAHDCRAILIGHSKHQKKHA